MMHTIKYSHLLEHGLYQIYHDFRAPNKMTNVWLREVYSKSYWYNNPSSFIANICIDDYIEDLYAPSQTELLLLQLEHDIVFVNDIKKPVNYQPTNPNFRKESWRKNKCRRV